MGSFGPDGDRDIDFGRVATFNLRVGEEARLSFSSNAGFEQALIIYQRDTMSNVVEKGTGGPRGLSDTTIRNTTGACLMGNDLPLPVSEFDEILVFITRSCSEADATSTYPA